MKITSPGVVILGGGATLLLAFLAIGYLLPADWEAEASVLLPVSAERVFELLDSPEGWQRWTAWPDSGLVRAGPAHGPGAMMAWRDQELGSGSFRIVESVPAQRVAYEVQVGEGSMRADGTITLASEREGVRITWRETGDLGRNPLMGYWALSMDRAQSAELVKSLDRLAALLSDSVRTR